MKFIEAPTNCPSCNSTLELVNDTLYCRSDSCPAQNAKAIEHFVKVLGIKGLGPKSLEKLNLESPLDLFYLEFAEFEAALGKTIATKIINEIEGAKEHATLATVIESFGIPLIGNTATTKIATVINTIDDITPETCKTAGLGDKATSNLMNWVTTEYLVLKDVMPFKMPNKKASVTTLGMPTVCITGKAPGLTKEQAGVELEKMGYKLVDGVTKTLNFLVEYPNPKGGVSTKATKAIGYSIPILNSIEKLPKR